jgi:hypothetical protein
MKKARKEKKSARKIGQRFGHPPRIESRDGQSLLQELNSLAGELSGDFPNAESHRQACFLRIGIID